MKLRYEMREESQRLVAIDPVYHDAAYAHALVQAMGELEAANQNDAADVVLTLAMIDERADELMIEWGYHEPEVPDERMA